MLVKYNGVDLEVERVVQWSDRNIYSEDGTERMFRHVAFAVQCVVNPMATTVADDDPFGGGDNPPSAPAIIAGLKRRLMRQRSELIVTVGGRVVLRSPARPQKADTPRINGSDGLFVHYCDARGGPNPLYCDVTSIHGTKTMLVTFALETWLVEQLFKMGEDNVNTAEQSALVSHRWEQSTDLDEHYYTTRTTTGRAVFRADYLYDFDEQTGNLYQKTRKPSDYLATLNHPLPPNYRRERVRTSIASDGLTLTYTIVDVEQQSTIEAERPVSRVEGTWQAGISNPDPLRLPASYTYINITCHGRRGCTYRELIRACLKAATTFDKQARLERRLYWSNSLTVDISRKRASLYLGYTINGFIAWMWDNGLLLGNVGQAGAFLGNPGQIGAALGQLVGGGQGQGVAGPNPAGGIAAALLGGVNLPFVFGIVGADVLYPENLTDGLGNSSRAQTFGQQPRFGMIGAVDDLEVQGGQRRMNTQQLGDGQFVPSYAPIATPQGTAGDEADEALRARGENARRIE